MNRIINLLLFLLMIMEANAKINIQRIDPTDWYVGMKNPQVQLMVYGKDIATVQEVTTDYPGAHIDSIVHLDSPNYLLVYMKLSTNSKSVRKQALKGRDSPMLTCFIC